MPHVDEIMAGQRAVVLEGDALQILPTLTGLVDHVCTDPPYGEEFHGKSRTQGKDGSVRVAEYGFEGLSDVDRSVLSVQFARLAKRWTLVFSDPESAHLWRDDLRAARLRYCRQAIWVKLGCTPQLTGDRPAAGHESISCAFASVETTPGRTVWNAGGKRGVYTHPIVSGEREHTTPKPLPLMLELVQDFTSPNDLILDPFGGSGTTAIAALRLGRRCLLVERDAKYAQLCRDRISAEETDSTLAAKRAGQLPLLPRA